MSSHETLFKDPKPHYLRRLKAILSSLCMVNTSWPYPQDHPFRVKRCTHSSRSIWVCITANTDMPSICFATAKSQVCSRGLICIYTHTKTHRCLTTYTPGMAKWTREQTILTNSQGCSGLLWPQLLLSFSELMNSWFICSHMMWQCEAQLIINYQRELWLWYRKHPLFSAILMWDKCPAVVAHWHFFTY